MDKIQWTAPSLFYWGLMMIPIDKIRDTTTLDGVSNNIPVYVIVPEFSTSLKAIKHICLHYLSNREHAC